MESRATAQNAPRTARKSLKDLCKLAIGGGLAFWVVTIAFSRLPVAAEFRTAFAIHYVGVVIVGSLLGGTVVGGLVSCFLRRLFGKLPTSNPVVKSVTLSAIALGMAMIMLRLVAIRIGAGATHYFLIGALLDVPRFFALGIAVGYLHKRLCGSELVKK